MLLTSYDPRLGRIVWTMQQLEIFQVRLSRKVPAISTLFCKPKALLRLVNGVFKSRRHVFELGVSVIGVEDEVVA